MDTNNKQNRHFRRARRCYRWQNLKISTRKKIVYVFNKGKCTVLYAYVFLKDKKKKIVVSLVVIAGSLFSVQPAKAIFPYFGYIIAQ